MMMLGLCALAVLLAYVLGWGHGLRRGQRKNLAMYLETLGLLAGLLEEKQSKRALMFIRQVIADPEEERNAHEFDA